MLATHTHTRSPMQPGYSGLYSEGDVPIIYTHTLCTGYKTFGLNKAEVNGVKGIMYREWAPAAKVRQYTVVTATAAHHTCTSASWLPLLRICFSVLSLTAHPYVLLRAPHAGRCFGRGVQRLDARG